MEYVPLHVKTSYSLLSSLNKIPNLVARAKQLNYSSLAITDTNNMFGVPEFYNECIKNNIKPIIGMELQIDDGKILLYAMNDNGYKNLIKLATITSETTITIDNLKEHSCDIILVIPYKYYNNEIYDTYKYKYIGYESLEEKLKISQPKVFINDVSYLNKEDYQYLDYLYMIKDSKNISNYELNTHKGKYLLTEEEINAICDKEDIENTLMISKLCNFKLKSNQNIMPLYDKNIDSYSYLKFLCNKGLNKRLNNNVSSEYINRLNYELKIINQMNFCNYFLIVWDYVKYAKLNNILVGPGRGSAAGSLVSYTLGITDIDPVKYNLLFERFLNPERVTMPDIDIDFDSNKRQEVIKYVTEKYGLKRVMGIITFDTLAAKQVIRDISRTMNLSITETDELCKYLSSKDNLLTTYNSNSKLKNLILNNPRYKKVFEIALHLEGLPRNIGIHASGIVMSRIDLDNIIPIYKNSRGVYTTGYSMNYLEPLGLLKMDFLGISNLTLIAEVIENIRKNEKINITFSKIPLDDKKTLDIFKKVKTDGIFQFESTGMKNFLRKLQVDSFDDIIAALALYRPGAMDYIDNYIRRKNGKEPIDYITDSLKPILSPTYGIIIYQEQIMQISKILAGYTLGEADILRRAIAKKKESILINEQPKFINKSIENGYSKEIAEKIYNLILKFANYGFNKSHSVGYATVAYKMAFLKTYFFSYFEVALLNNVIGNDIKTRTYLNEIKEAGIKILPPDINLSTEKYTIEEKAIRCPLSIIRNIGTSVSKEIINTRKLSPYKNFIDFVKKNYSSTINKKILTSLILAGCFNEMGYNENTLINNLDNIINYADLLKDAGMLELSPPELEKFPDLTQEEKLNNQLVSYGFYLSEHPTNIYKNQEDIVTKDVKLYFDKNISIVLMINSIKEITTKKNDIMAFINAQDEFGSISLTLFPKTYKNYLFLKKKNIIRVFGRVEKRYDQYQIIVNSIKKLA